jgi:hypothetical protein
MVLDERKKGAMFGFSQSGKHDLAKQTNVSPSPLATTNFVSFTTVGLVIYGLSLLTPAWLW